MSKTILLTGATDGIGFETAKLLVAQGHTLLIHGRNPEKLLATEKLLFKINGADTVQRFCADLSDMQQVESLAQAVAAAHPTIDVVINNAGVFSTPKPVTKDQLDVRFVVNTLAPYLLTQRLLPHLSSTSRVVNLSSAAQAPVNLDALSGKEKLSANHAYAQSKLAITMWTFHLARKLGSNGPILVAVNPASLLASKMVKDAYGVDGNDLGIGADILVRAALSDEFAKASGHYYDNDNRRFSQPHPDALDPDKNAKLVGAIESTLGTLNTH